MDQSDVRWKQRLANFQKALAQLASAFELNQTRTLSQLEKQGVIQAFEFTHEDVADDLFASIFKVYFRLFDDLNNKMESLLA